MRYASFSKPCGTLAFGALSPDGVWLCDLRDAELATLRAALAVWGPEELARRAQAATYDVPAADVRWLPPIVDPAKIICVGVNYAAHATEAGRDAPPYPSLFPRFADSFVGHLQPVQRPRLSQMFDYEAELAVVIGRAARHVSEADALHHVAGYCCMAENSVRDFQKHTGQVTAGKNFFESGAFGPWLTSADAVGDPARLEVIGRLNGQEMQRDSVGHMVFSIARIIAYISAFTPLAPGDVIATGTPSGVGAARKPPVFLRDGDLLEVEIPGIGLLRNPVVDESAT
jgi:2-keto-4-pentenoate hydratase/2-oxohepta-3-ene-1,7-dioic acid hydratase in catechol pathway